jgi:hypothetical protein
MSTTTTMPKRHRARWSNAELNRLCNEYEIKELTVQEIASFHGRTVCAVMSKLQMEGLISSSWDNARGWSFQNQTISEQGISLKPSIQFEQDDDDDDVDDESVESDDSDDADYLPDEEDEDDNCEEEDDDDDEDYDQHSIKQKVTFLEQQIANIFSFLQKNLPNKQKTMNATI